MTKDVLISIKSTQSGENGENQIETINPGLFYRKNNKVYVKYEEVIEGFDKTVGNMIKITDDCVEVSKRGVISNHMIFNIDEKVQTSYESPFGTINLVINTDMLKIEETEKLLHVELKYSLEYDGQKISTNTITINVTPKGDEMFHLLQD